MHKSNTKHYTRDPAEYPPENRELADRVMLAIIQGFKAKGIKKKASDKLQSLVDAVVRLHQARRFVLANGQMGRKSFHLSGWGDLEQVRACVYVGRGEWGGIY